MTRDEHKRYITEMLGLATPENQARASEILTTLSEDYEQVLTDGENSTNRINELTENNETLRRVNSQLFLKVGHTVPKEETPPPTDEGNGIPDMTYEALFNDKGELI